jgi:hypothetical protein
MIRTKTSWSFLLAVVVCLWAGAAAAAGKRVGVPAFDGAQEALVRKKVMAVLQAHGFELAKSRQISAALQSTGARLDSNDGFQALAKELALNAIVTGEVGKKKAKITVYDGREGSTLGDATFSGANPKKLAADVARNFWRKLGAAVNRGRVPSNAKKGQKAVAESPEDAVDTSATEGEEEEKPAPPKKAPVAEAEKEKGTEEGEEKPKKKKQKEEQEEEPSGPSVVPPTLDVAVGARVLMRNFTYHQPLSKLRPYKLGGAPAAALDLIWYPLSYLTDGFAQHLGIEVHLEQAFAISSKIGAGDPDFPDGAKFNTVVHEYAGGLRFRVPFGGGSQFYVSATGGEHAFVFRSSGTSNRHNLDIPDVIYRYAQPAVGIRFELPADLSLDLSTGYRYIFNGGGQIKDTYFPHLGVGGVDMKAAVGWRVTPNIEVRATGELRRYFFSMNSRPEDAGQEAAGVRISGGAVDQYVTGTVSIAFMFGGSEPAGEPEESSPPPAKKKAKAAAEGDEEEGSSEGGGGDE